MSARRGVRYSTVRGAKVVVAAAVTVSVVSISPITSANAATDTRPPVQKTKSVTVSGVPAESKSLGAVSKAAKTPLSVAKWPKKGLTSTHAVTGTWVDTIGGVSLRATKAGSDESTVAVESLGQNSAIDGFAFRLSTAAPAADPSTPAPSDSPTTATPSPETPTETPTAPSTPEADSSTVKPSLFKSPGAPSSDSTAEPSTEETPSDTTEGSDESAPLAPLQVQIDYSTFAHGYGADWADRLSLVQVNDCAAAKTGVTDEETTPEDCAPTTPLKAVNDAENQTLTATLPAQESASTMTLAVQAAAGGSKGDFSASPLSAASSWAAGTQSGDFNWSYPIDVPPGVGGPEPSLALAYSSGIVDGRISSTNNQASWVGEGFSLDPGFVERTYETCRDVDTNTTGSDETNDLCWRNDNLSLSFSGGSGKLIRDGSTNQWHLKNDDGTKVELKTSAGINTDNDGEYWVVTTPDGTKYYFGRNERFTGDTHETDSVSTVPVYGSRAGEPCHQSTFGTSDCRQAWRWSLDYVVDAHGNSMSLFYDQETNSYGSNDGATTVSYDRAPLLKSIEYGTRTGTENDSSAPAKVVFGTDERCLTTETFDCTGINDGDNATHWPDVPADQLCSSSCGSHTTPTFFSRKRLTTITTQTLSSGSYSDVNQWKLTHTFPSSGEDESRTLWLASIQQTGKVGGSTTLPATTFTGVQKPNRVDEVGDNINAFYKWRVNAILNGMGGSIGINYSGADCSYTDKPSASALDTNSRRCFPAYFQPEGATSPQLEFFHKYRVASVVESDNTGGAPAVQTSYTYSGGDGWHFDDNDAQRDKYRTWNQWRGYSEVTTEVGSTGTKSYSTSLYLRGMDGDKAQGGGTKSVTVTDPLGSAPIQDKDELQGFERRTQTKLGASGAILATTTNTPWDSDPTATNAEGEKAHMVRVGKTETKTRLSDGSFRTTSSTSTFNADGLPTTVDDAGDTSVATDNQCTTTTYAVNRTAWLTSLPASTTTTSGSCGTAPQNADDVLSATRVSYDGGAVGDAPTHGDVTKSESAHSWSSGITYQTDSTNTYDNYGRLTSTKNADDATTTTDYSPATGVPTTVTATNPLGQTTVTKTNLGWGTPAQTINVAGAKTDYEYDPLGRVTSVWVPGRQKDSGLSATYTYSYLTRDDGANAVTTNTLNAAAGYATSIQFYDGLLRERSTQAQSPGEYGGRLVTEKIYDSRGLVVSDRGPYWNSSDPSTTLVSAQENEIPSYTNYVMDAAGRTTSATLASTGAPKWTTTTSYGGDRVNVTPPAGGTATTTITDARGQTKQLLQYTGTTPTGTADTTSYAYTPRGNLKTITNSSGTVWNRSYDIRGRLTQSVDPDAGTSNYTYDDLDRQVTSSNGKGETLWTGYDDLGRKTSSRDDSSSGAQRASWTYDTVKPGLLSSSTRFVGTDEYTNAVTSYDEAGNPTASKIVLPTSEGLLYRAGGYLSTATYFPDNSIKKQIGPSLTGIQNEAVSYNYDALGNVRTMSGVGSFVSDTIYSPYGQVLQRELGPTSGMSVYDNRTYDAATGRLTRKYASVQTTATTPRVDLRYTYDDSGNVTRLNDFVAGDTTGASASTTKQCFSYDYLRRMTKAWTSSTTTCAAPTSTNLGTQSPYWDAYTYGKQGNRLTWVAKTLSGSTLKTTTHTSTYPAATAAHPAGASKVVDTGTTTGTETFAYDAAGQTTTRSTSATVGQTIVWDREGHEQSVTTKAGKVTSFVYDADGNRLIKRDGVAGSTTLFMGPSEYTMTGTTLSAVRSYSVNGEPVIVRDSAGLKVLIDDAQNTPVLQVNGTTGAFTKRRYSPFGGVLLAQPAWPINRGFLDKSADASTGTNHLGAREYDPKLGKFLSPDPVIDPMNPQQMNPYAYANNTPITSSDAGGLFANNGEWQQSPTHHTSTPWTPPSGSGSSSSGGGGGGGGGGSFVPSPFGQSWYAISRGLGKVESHVASFFKDAVVPKPKECFGSQGSKYGCFNFTMTVGTDLFVGAKAIKGVQILVDTVRAGTIAADTAVTAPKALAAATRVAPWAGSSLSRLSSSGEVMYRVWGGGAEKAGSWLTPINPVSSAAARQGLALPAENAALYVSKVTLPGGIRMQVGAAGQAFGQPGGWTQAQLLERIPLSSFGKGVPLE